MDCDTAGVEPDFALVKLKTLAGGGTLRIINQSVPLALERLGYDETQCDEIIRYVLGNGTLEGAPSVNRESLKRKGLSGEIIDGLGRLRQRRAPGVLPLRPVPARDDSL